ncbi:hypothetical protein QKW35_21160 [Pontibacterium granulatum]|uniref:hypothetical protein n=1 Tax=Pontibacterium granulatum TaxID=2036029 RepID=UPI00249AB3CE|nr:hypothetical protein [Pontibacterium granulatum]MDI3326893.1 hypothetical protein [Pontibacterium granulatum]
MKKQIRRFSPHQNAKVFAVLMAVSIVPFFVPMLIMMGFTMPDVDRHGNPIDFPMMMFWMMPFIYLIFGYISVAIGCAIYNFLFRFVGGIEVEISDIEDA